MRWLLIISALVLAILAVGSRSTAKGAEFSCQDRVLTDYAQPLRKMPADRLPGERLPFAPRDVELRPAQSVMVEGAPIAFALELARPASADGRTARPVNLNWEFTLRLETVNQLGRPTSVSGQRSWRVRKLRHPARLLALRADPGLYRVSVSIRKIGGRNHALANFWQFVRVLPLRKKLSVGIRGGKTFQPGETIAARVENRGTREALLPAGSGLTVEHLEGRLWVEAESEEPPSMMFEDPEFLPGGRASRCSFFTIPADSAEGAFRFSAVVQTGSGTPRTVYEQFAVSSIDHAP